MEKLKMCRMCLVKNVRMFLVVNKNLHELYEKLTGISFVTEDSRPILACFFCCAKLKRCYRLLRQCLEAEELFAQMMNEDYETNPLINQNHLEVFNGFIKSPTENISIVDECQTENIAIKEELPAVCERFYDIIEPKEEHQSDEQELENFDNNCPDVADIPAHDSESQLEDDVFLTEFKTEVGEEQDVFNIKQARKTERTLIKCTFSRLHFFEIWSAVTGSTLQKHQHVLGTILASLDEVDNLDIRNLDRRILNLCKSLERYWKVSRSKSKILRKHSDWLNEIECVELVRSNEQCIQENGNRPGASGKRGRPRKDFSKRNFSEISRIISSR